MAGRKAKLIQNALINLSDFGECVQRPAPRRATLEHLLHGYGVESARVRGVWGANGLDPGSTQCEVKVETWPIWGATRGGSLLGQVSVDAGSIWDWPGTKPWTSSSRGRVGVDSVRFGAGSRLNVGVDLGCFGVVLLSIWDRFGIEVVTIGGRLRGDPRSTWGRMQGKVAVDLQSIRRIFRVGETSTRHRIHVIPESIRRRSGVDLGSIRCRFRVDLRSIRGLSGVEGSLAAPSHRTPSAKEFQ